MDLITTLRNYGRVSVNTHIFGTFKDLKKRISFIQTVTRVKIQKYKSFQIALKIYLETKDKLSPAAKINIQKPLVTNMKVILITALESLTDNINNVHGLLLLR